MGEWIELIESVAYNSGKGRDELESGDFMAKKPNIVLIMADQFRYDAIHAHGNEFISTPTLDQFVRTGIDFSNAYSATPTCVPARASLLSGLSQKNTGIVGYAEGANWNFPTLLGEAFSSIGYYAKAVGKMHVSPPRKLCGFHHIDLHDGYLHATRNTHKQVRQSYEQTDDYFHWLKQQVNHPIDLNDSGLDCNSWVARPFPYEERLHPTNWATEKAIDFLRWRDPEMPFFLKLSYVRPHSPLDPPSHYFDMYMDIFKEISHEDFSTWAKEMGLEVPVDTVDSLSGTLSMIDYKRMLAGYYGLVTQIDHQINRFLIHLQENQLLEDTIIVFTSDHGDQLGEHALYRKGYPYQGSIHIPFIIVDPGANIAAKDKLKTKVDDIVELRDVLPTLIDLTQPASIPDVDGCSIKPILFKQHTEEWRDYLHGEHILGDYSSQFILKDDWKYIWFTQTNTEQLFNLKVDPKERQDLSAEEPQQVSLLRGLLIDELDGRPEGFVSHKQLVAGRKQKPLVQEDLF